MEACANGLLPSANFFQKSMSVHILSRPLYRICEVYIALFQGQDDEYFLRSPRDIVQICREKGVKIILSVKKLVLGRS